MMAKGNALVIDLRCPRDVQLAAFKDWAGSGRTIGKAA
jgi:hypothetical protein